MLMPDRPHLYQHHAPGVYGACAQCGLDLSRHIDRNVVLLAEALERLADALVVVRAITRAPNP